MKILFIHQNMTGQYKHLVYHFLKDKKNEIYFVTNRKNYEIEGVKKIYYDLTRATTQGVHRYVSPLENAVIYGQEVARKLIALKNSGVTPDVICVHPGWGEGLFIKDVYPDVPVIHFCEFYYHAFGADCFFEPNKDVNVDSICRLRIKNAHLLLSAESMDWGVSPTIWQWMQFAPDFRKKISIIHDGIDTDFCAPKDNATFPLPNGKVLTRKDEVVTYVARNLEPYRGFPTFMKALEIMTKRRPNTHFLVVGGDGVSYGAKLPEGQTYREILLKQTKITDPSRVHFMGRVPYDQFQNIFRVSSAHIYLTYPFVLSWSFLEAMANEALIIGSSSAPVEEVIQHGKNGFLADFFSPEQIADRVDDIFAHKNRYEDLRKAARQTVLDKYDLSKCLPQQIDIIEKFARREGVDTLPTNHPPYDVIAPWERVENIRSFNK